MHKNLQKVNWKFWLVLAGVAVAVVMLWGPIRKLIKGTLGGITDLFNQTFAGLNSGMGQVNDWLGLNKGISDEVEDKLSPGLDDPWNPNYYKSYPDAVYFTVAKNRQLISRIKDAVHWWSGVDMGKLTGVFSEFENKAQFSYFCNTWLHDEGTSLQAWLVDGWLGGLVASVGDSDFVKLSRIIDQLPTG